LIFAIFLFYLAKNTAIFANTNNNNNNCISKL